MNAESKLLIGALRRAVAGTTEALSLSVDWQALLKLARMHMLLPLLYDGLHREPKDWEKVPEAAKKLLHQSFLQAVYQDTRMDQRCWQLEQKLIQEDVPHIFLKGSVLKQDYPVPALRTMCDLDVLVYTEDYPKLDAVAEAMGGKLGHGDGNHRNYSFPGGVTVEFHPNLIHHDVPVGTQINPGWQYGDPDDPHKLTEEGFYLNTICHLANHFVAGGVGVRFVLDVWVNCHRRKPEADRTIVEAELERFGLLDFARKIEALAEWWFGSGESTLLLEELGEYILTSGSHGNTDRAILNAVSLSPGGTGTSALLSKAFFSRAEMEDRFPWCKGRPWLLPVAWLVRACRAVTKHGSHILTWSKGTGKITNEQAVRQKEKLERFGIRRNKK